MKMVNNPVKYEVLIKQYLRSILDISETGCINALLRLSKKENVLIINKMNITKLTNAVYSESYWVTSLMVYAFHGVNISSIRCILKQLFTSVSVACGGYLPSC